LESKNAERMSVKSNELPDIPLVFERTEKVVGFVPRDMSGARSAAEKLTVGVYSDVLVVKGIASAEGVRILNKFDKWKLLLCEDGEFLAVFFEAKHLVHGAWRLKGNALQLEPDFVGGGLAALREAYPWLPTDLTFEVERINTGSPSMAIVINSKPKVQMVRPFVLDEIFYRSKK
jgi:hypothetical protein